ncbi:MAG TPA: pentapeptide repeat-containing protein, partial [Gammaproteobacteria bacterium]|nr:pentapeptide repeat-containing protein [Gammaproteobacteria bacterium]
SLDDARSAAKELLAAGDKTFAELCKLGGLDPRTDFRWADLHGIDFSGQPLEGFDFRGADLRNANLRGARIEPSQLEGADLSGALLDRAVPIKPFTLCLSGDDGWETPGEEERSKLFEAITPIDDVLRCEPKSSTLQARPLYWWKNWFLLRLEDETWSRPHLRVYHLINGPRLLRLDGTSLPIHEANEAAPLKLRDQDVLDYLRFFCYFVHGENGPFYIVEDVGDPLVRPALAARTLPAKIETRGADGRWVCKAHVWYGTALFKAEFAVDPSGTVEMLDDEPIEVLEERIAAPLTVHESATRLE